MKLESSQQPDIKRWSQTLYYPLGHRRIKRNDIPFVPEAFIDLTDTVLCREARESGSVLFVFVVCGGGRQRHPADLARIPTGKGSSWSLESRQYN